MIKRFIPMVLCAAMLACSSSDSPTGSSSTPPANTVAVRNDFFQPATLTVKPGTTVTWQWESNGVEHGVIFDTVQIASAIQGSGTFTHTFTTEGTFAYHCQVHGTVMSGKIVVSAAASTNPPPSDPPTNPPPPTTPYP
jgi:plastocyanin